MNEVMLTNKSVSDDLIAVGEERSVSSALFAAVFPLYTTSSTEMQRHACHVHVKYCQRTAPPFRTLTTPTNS